MILELISLVEMAMQLLIIPPANNYSDFINDQDYGDWEEDVDFDQVLETIRNPFNKTKDDSLTLYDEDYYEDWDYEEEAGHPDYDDLITPNDQDYYEDWDY